MRESIKRLLMNSEPNEAAVWMYRMMLLGLVALIALKQVGGETSVAIGVAQLAIYAGFAIAAAEVILRPLLCEAKEYWRTHG